ncbi:uncharacterized protein BDZ99DRAFT_466021 [Mytilinidion resinicola]|uniref:Uncharacterized protein n=1 Tax=Mytilinidion resinicola TaxID=574789 RepID=A0A6A6YF11_9PEZI|nr:uncharacterized protein BDZ99DRAFT_466021 [Mytilinidion resinicola]KAF2806447.1 hypothetical protein BDZ99DRAFT_466021 [Mytilinidion resinicola]
MFRPFIPRAGTRRLANSQPSTALSSQRIRFSTSKPTFNADSKPPKIKNPSFGGASLKELGATRTVKIVVIIALTIAGTAESIFWAKVLWAKFAPSSEDEGGEEL